MNQSPISSETLTPKPENVRPATRKVLVWLFAIAFVLTAGKWYYDEMVLPKQPLEWADYDEEELAEKLSEGRKVLILYESSTDGENIAMRDAVENKRNRKYVRRNRMLTLKLTDKDSNLQVESLQGIVPDLEAPALLVLVGQANEDLDGGDLPNESSLTITRQHVWDGKTVKADDLYEILYELRVGRKPPSSAEQ